MENIQVYSVYGSSSDRSHALKRRQLRQKSFAVRKTSRLSGMDTFHFSTRIKRLLPSPIPLPMTHVEKEMLLRSRVSINPY